MTPAEFTALVERLEERAIEANRCGAVSNQADTKAQLALLTALRETRAALKMLHDDNADYIRLNNLYALDNHCMKAARAALSAYPLAEPTRGEG